jgi:hypothetical protein
LFSFIEDYDAELSGSMRDSFDALSHARQSRFMMAPETIHQIRQLRRRPAKSLLTLCTFLNAETLLEDNDARLTSRCWTALGDFCYDGGIESGLIGCEPVTDALGGRTYAPYLAGTIVVDFSSPNVRHAKETTVVNDYCEYSFEDVPAVCKALEDALMRITRISELAACLIKRFVKVIIPFKVSSGSGSTSERCLPGLVLLQGITNADPARLASALVHEAMHQLLYVLEYQGQFVIREPAEQVTSLWSGRALQLHSFFHACFVWYGLANFWSLAKACDAFDESDVHREWTRSLSGFRGPNPIDTLHRNARLVRSDALRVARSLQEHLRGAITQ